MEMRLKDLREDHDLSQKELGEAINLPQRTYSSYETGNRMITPEILCKIADFYGVSVDYLLRRTDIPETADEILKRVKKRQAPDTKTE